MLACRLPGRRRRQMPVIHCARKRQAASAVTRTAVNRAGPPSSGASARRTTARSRENLAGSHPKARTARENRCSSSGGRASNPDHFQLRHAHGFIHQPRCSHASVVLDVGVSSHRDAHAQVARRLPPRPGEPVSLCYEGHGTTTYNQPVLYPAGDEPSERNLRGSWKTAAASRGHPGRILPRRKAGDFPSLPPALYNADDVPAA